MANPPYYVLRRKPPRRPPVCPTRSKGTTHLRGTSTMGRRHLRVAMGIFCVNGGADVHRVLVASRAQAQAQAEAEAQAHRLHAHTHTHTHTHRLIAFGGTGNALCCCWSSTDGSDRTRMVYASLDHCTLAGAIAKGAGEPRASKRSYTPS